MSQARERMNQLAREYLQRGDTLGWYDRLYQMAEGDASVIPWADLRPNPNLVAWAEHKRLAGGGRTAIVVGCGLGDDSEALNGLGFQVTAFDISPTAIEWVRQRRFPSSPVDYRVADLFDLPGSWNGGFDFVLESYTLQSLPPALRAEAIDAIAALPRPGGTLLVICRARDDAEPPGERIPSPLSRAELARFRQAGLLEVAFEDYTEADMLPVRRFRVEYVVRDV